MRTVAERASFPLMGKGDRAEGVVDGVGARCLLDKHRDSPLPTRSFASAHLPHQGEG